MAIKKHYIKYLNLFFLNLFILFTLICIYKQIYNKELLSLPQVISRNHTQYQINALSLFLSQQEAQQYAKLNSHISYIPLPDTRIIALRKFLKDYKSPMYKYASDIVQQADAYNQDWRIIVAISGVESAFGRITRPNSFNAWGWKGGSRGNFSNFKNWQDAIAYITRKFTNGYGSYPNPYDFYKTYCPPCTTAWPDGVTRYMKQLNQYRKLENQLLIKRTYEKK